MTIAIYGFCALIMIGLGIAQWKGPEPAGFYSGVKPPKAEELTDVNAWNRKHGLMWIGYGVILFLSGLAGGWMGDSALCLIPLLGGALLPLGFMACYHERLMSVYKKRGK